jgi:hypothetical protein
MDVQFFLFFITAMIIVVIILLKNAEKNRNNRKSTVFPKEEFEKLIYLDWVIVEHINPPRGMPDSAMFFRLSSGNVEAFIQYFPTGNWMHLGVLMTSNDIRFLLSQQSHAKSNDHDASLLT